MRKAEFKKYLVGIAFFVLSKGLSIKLAEACDLYREQKRKESNPDESEEMDEQELAEFLEALGVTIDDFKELARPKFCPLSMMYLVSEHTYLGLGQLARRDNYPGKEFEVAEFFKMRLTKSLNFEPDQELIAQIAQEFNNWAEEKKELVTGWGTFTYVPDGKFSLVSNPVRGGDSN